MPPPNPENDEQAEASEVPEVQAPEVQAPETPVIQQAEEATELADSLAAETGNEKVDVSENSIAQENESETPSEPPIEQIKVFKGSTRGSSPRRRVGRPNKERYTKRHSFEIFTDQLIDLRLLQARHELRHHEKVTLSEMVRKALDTYLQENGHSNPMFRPEARFED